MSRYTDDVEYCNDCDTYFGAGKRCRCSSEPAGILQTYEPEKWLMRKDAIYAARSALVAGIENTQERLMEHDAVVGRMKRSTRMTAERLEREIREMQSAIQLLQRPDDSPDDE